MRIRALTLIAVVACVPILRAQDKARTPTLVLRVQGLDNLVADVHYLAAQAGRGEEARQFERLLKSMTGDKGIEGLDTKRPMALYAFASGQIIDSKAVLMLPVADQKDFLATLKRLGINTDKEKDGIYETQPEGLPIPAHFRFAHGYIYATIGNPDAIRDKVLLRPAVVIPPGDRDVISVTLDLSNFPTELRDLALGQLELRGANLKEKQEGESKAQHAFHTALLDDAVGFLRSVLTDGGQMTFRFAVNRQVGDVSVSVSLAGRPGSPLANRLANLGKTSSVAAGVVNTRSAMSSRVTLELPEEVRKKLTPVVDEGIGSILEQTKQDEIKGLIKPLLDAAAPTLKQGRLDVALDFRGPSEKKLYTIVGGGGLKGGQAIEKAVKESLEKLPGNAAAREKISLNVAKVGEINIHRLNIEKDLKEDARQSLGENPLYFALRDDALFFALGEGGLPALKDALGGKAKAGPVMRLEMSLLQMAALMGIQQKAAPSAAKEAFGQGKGSDRVEISLEGGRELRLRLGMSGAVLKFFNLLDKAEKEEKKDQ
jgi:hypothetical protein